MTPSELPRTVLLTYVCKKPIKKQKSPSAKAKRLEIVRLHGWLSQSVLLWDNIGFEMKRVRSGHRGIDLIP
jgi:hypothetical protein